MACSHKSAVAYIIYIVCFLVTVNVLINASILGVMIAWTVVVENKASQILSQVNPILDMINSDAPGLYNKTINLVEFLNRNTPEIFTEASKFFIEATRDAVNFKTLAKRAKRLIRKTIVREKKLYNSTVNLLNNLERLVAKVDS